MLHRRTPRTYSLFHQRYGPSLLADSGYETETDCNIPAVVAFAARDPKSRTLTAVQRAGVRLAPHFSMLAVGGYSLLVVARPAP